MDSRVKIASQKMVDRQKKIRVPEIIEGNWLQPRIALTFDDGPHPIMTSRLLERLKQLDVVATFFLVGKRMRFHPDIVERILLDGHEIGNHTYHHVRLPCLPPMEVLNAFLRTDATLRLITGYGSRLVRPPGGEYSPSISRLLASQGYINVLWTCDPADYKPGRTARDITRLILRDITPGGTILLHSGLQTTIESLEGTVSSLRDRGYTFATVSDMIIAGGTTHHPARDVSSRTRVDDTSDDIGKIYGESQSGEDYALKLRNFQYENPALNFQRFLNQSRKIY